jgi:hypothetical protein
MKEGIGDVKLSNELAKGHCQGKEKTDCRWFYDRTESLYIVNPSLLLKSFCY